MKTTADKFRKKPHDIYAEAAKGETVTINHDRYRDQVFELTARSREPLYIMSESTTEVHGDAFNEQG